MTTLFTQFAAEGHEETATGVAALGIDAKAFIIQLITFLFVYLVLKKYVFQRIVDALAKRQETIEKGVNLTGELTKQKEQLDREVAEKHREARKEAEKIVADTHAQATQILKEAEENAQAKAEQILADARQKIEDETARARRNLEREMVDLVIEATEKVSGEKLDAKKDNALIESALKGQA